MERREKEGRVGRKDKEGKQGEGKNERRKKMSERKRERNIFDGKLTDLSLLPEKTEKTRSRKDIFAKEMKKRKKKK